MSSPRQMADAAVRELRLAAQDAETLWTATAVTPETLDRLYLTVLKSSCALLELRNALYTPNTTQSFDRNLL